MGSRPPSVPCGTQAISHVNQSVKTANETATITVSRSRFLSTTVDPATLPLLIPPPNISDTPPPLPACSRIRKMSASETSSWTTATIPVSNLEPFLGSPTSRRAGGTEVCRSASASANTSATFCQSSSPSPCPAPSGLPSARPKNGGRASARRALLGLRERKRRRCSQPRIPARRSRPVTGEASTPPVPVGQRPLRLRPPPRDHRGTRSRSVEGRHRGGRRAGCRSGCSAP
jgi:hypothetical protein